MTSLGQLPVAAAHELAKLRGLSVFALRDQLVLRTHYELDCMRWRQLLVSYELIIKYVVDIHGTRRAAQLELGSANENEPLKNYILTRARIARRANPASSSSQALSVPIGGLSEDIRGDKRSNHTCKQ